jgi:1-acyl-sn-glycerol-3-phosphate acyltransferase
MAIIFKRGAANIAMRARCNVTPVLIRCAPPMLIKGEKWWRLPSSPSRYVIEVQEDIDIRPFIAEAGSTVLAARRFTDYLQDYFTQEKICHGIG